MDSPEWEKQTGQEKHREAIVGEEALRWLAFVGNDERKLIILLALYQASEPLGKSGLYHYLQQLAGDTRIPGVLNSPFQFCKDSLAQVGIAEETTAQVMRFGDTPITAPAFEITNESENRHFGLAFAGALLGWSRDHPELSLNILGQTSSKHDNRAPLIRFWSLYDISTTKDSPKSPSITHIAQHLNIPHTTLSNTADRLRQLGLVKNESSVVENKRQFRIINPEYKTGPRKRAYEKLQPETQMLFTAFKEAFKTKDTWGMDEFMNLVAELYPDASLELFKKARERMQTIFYQKVHHLLGVVEPQGERLYDAMSRVELLPEVKQAIAELVAIIDGFYSGDQKYIESGATLANEIISDPALVARLYQKAYDNSNNAVRDPEFETRLVNIVRGATARGMTTTAIRDLYALETGRRISTKTVQTRLGSLVARGQLVLNTSPASQTKQQPVGFYRVSSSEE